MYITGPWRFQNPNSFSYAKPPCYQLRQGVELLSSVTSWRIKGHMYLSYTVKPLFFHVWFIYANFSIQIISQNIISANYNLQFIDRNFTFQSPQFKSLRTKIQIPKFTSRERKLVQSVTKPFTQYFMISAKWEVVMVSHISHDSIKGKAWPVS